MRRKLLLWAVPVLVVMVGLGLYWFAPWKLFTNTTVDDALALPVTQSTGPAPAPTGPPASGSAAGPVLLASGTFVTHEHTTTGTARIVRTPDGTRQLELVDLSTSDGPDLRVWLSDQALVPGRDGWEIFDQGRYVELGHLKGNRGNQVYPIPADVDLPAYRSVTIWCIRFSVSFGAAPLAPTVS